MKLRIACAVIGFLSPALSLVPLTLAQTSTQTASALPRLVRFGGTVKDLNGTPLTGVVGITFAFYSEETGGAPLWLETQNAAADSAGHYTVLLGSTKPDGLPAELFTSEQARWVGVQVSGQAEQPRVLLVSAPYALKAGDAETIGGLPPSAFVLAAPPNSGATTATSDSAEATTASSVTPAVSSDVTTTGGTVNTIPLFTTATNIQNSILTQTGTLAVNVVGKLNLPSTAAATKTAGADSRILEFVASSFSSTSSAAVNQNFQWRAEPAANDTASPSGTLNLLYSLGTAVPTETGLELSSKGIFTFATGQTFPGAGTITGITAGTALTGGGTSGNVTLSVDTTQVPLLAANNYFTGNNSFSATSTPIYAVSSSANSGTIEGVQTAACCKAIGVYGQSADSSGFGVEGYDTASTGSPIGVYGLTFAPGGSGVYGSNGASTGEPTGVTGITPNCSDCGYGVYGSGGIAGVVGTSNSGYAMIAQGNVEQCLGCGGWVKGMVYVNGQTTPYSIVRCFNSTLGGSAATTPPCGFKLSDVDRSGEWIVDFGFAVTGRFWSATLAAPNTGINGTPSIAADNPWPGVTLTATQLFVVVYSAQPPNWNFSLVVY